MSQLKESETEMASAPYSYATFECGACAKPVQMTRADAVLLADNQPVACPQCNVSIKAAPRDQDRLIGVQNSLVKSGKFIIPFAIVWFSMSFLMGLFVDSKVSVVMTGLGLIISMGLKGKTPVIHDVMRLNHEVGQERCADNKQD